MVFGRIKVSERLQSFLSFVEKKKKKKMKKVNHNKKNKIKITYLTVWIIGTGEMI